MGLTIHVAATAHSAAKQGKKLFATHGGPTINCAYTPEPKDLSTKIVFIQVMRELLEGVASLPSQLDPGFGYQDADTTGRKYHVDYVTGENDPYYNGDDPQDIGKQGSAAAHLSAGAAGFLNAVLPGASSLVDAILETATMSDTPHYSEATFPAGKSKMKYEFRTAAFSAAGADAGVYYQYQDWTYEKEAGTAEKLTLVTTGADPGQDFKDAVDLWSKNRGFRIPKPAPPPHPAVVAPGTKTYVVVSGDYLSKIAQKFYGNGNLWPKIYSANTAVIGGDPNLILPGQALVIP